MEFLLGFRTFRDDPDWLKKFVFVALLILSSSIIPVLGQAVAIGWAVQALRRYVISGKTSPLPALHWDTDYLGELLMVGFKTFIVQMVWTIPLFALIFGSAIASVAAGATLGEDMGPVVGVILSLLVLPLTLALTIPMMLAVARTELTGRLEDGFAVGRIFSAVRLVGVDLIVGIIVVGFVSFIALMLGALLCCVGMYFSAGIALYANAMLHGVIYRRYAEKGGEPWEVAPPVAGAFEDSSGMVDTSVFE